MDLVIKRVIREELDSDWDFIGDVVKTESTDGDWDFVDYSDIDSDILELFYTIDMINERFDDGGYTIKYNLDEENGIIRLDYSWGDYDENGEERWIIDLKSNPIEASKNERGSTVYGDYNDYGTKTRPYLFDDIGDLTDFLNKNYDFTH